MASIRNRRTEEKTIQSVAVRHFRKVFLDADRNLREINNLAAIISSSPEQQLQIEKENKRLVAELENKTTQALLVQALGYQYEEVKIVYEMKKGSWADGKFVPGEWIPKRKVVTTKFQPGNSQLFIFYKTNVSPDKWKVSKELLMGKAEGYDSKPSQRIRKAIESLARDVLEQDTDRPETEHPVSDGLARLPVGSDKNGQK